MSLLLLILLPLDPPANWHWYQTEDKRLSLAFPTKPVEQTKSQKMSQGDTTVTTITIPRTRVDEAGFVLTWFDFKRPKIEEAEIKQYLQGVEQGSINSKQGRRLNTRSINFDKYHGREFTWRIETGYIRTQLFMIKARFVTLMYMAETEQALSSQEAQLFFSSLKVKE